MSKGPEIVPDVDLESEDEVALEQLSKMRERRSEVATKMLKKGKRK